MTINKGELIRLRKLSPAYDKDQNISIENKDGQEIGAFVVLSEQSGTQTFDLSMLGALTSEQFSKVIMPLATALLSTGSKSITAKFEG